jgi:hypothetical protein
MKHKVNSASEVEAVIKLVARTQLATTRQGAFESRIDFKQRYTNALKVCNPPAYLNEIFMLLNTLLQIFAHQYRTGILALSGSQVRS